MSIDVKFNVKIEIVKIYSLKFTNHKIMNEIFDKLYVQKRMKYINQFTLYEYLMFVV